MTEFVEPLKTHSDLRKPRRLKLFDIIIGVVVLAVIIALCIFLFQRISLKNEVSAARTVTDAVAANIQKQDAAAVRAAGDGAYQSANSETKLKALFTQAAPYIKNNSTISSQTVSNSSDGQSVAIVYHYDGSTPFYIRLQAVKTTGDWQLHSLNGNVTNSFK